MTRDLTNIAKPCPMCGSKRIYMPYPKHDIIYTVCIKCADCGLTGYKNMYKDVNVDEAMDRVIKYWNTRAVEPSLKLFQRKKEGEANG